MSSTQYIRDQNIYVMSATKLKLISSSDGQCLIIIRHVDDYGHKQAAEHLTIPFNLYIARYSVNKPQTKLIARYYVPL